MKNNIVRILVIAVFIALFGLFFYFHLYQYLSFDALKEYRQQLLMWTAQHYLLMMISFMAVYIIAVATSVPGATFLTLAGGFLFGITLGTVYVVISATLGSILVFLAVKTVVGSWLVERASGWVARLEKGFQENAFNYLLTLRLVPLFPFWLVNIVPAILNVPLRTFIITTAFGIIPGSLVYVMLGNSLGILFEQGRTPDLGIIFQPYILIPLLGLAFLSLLPVFYKQIKGKNE